MLNNKTSAVPEEHNLAWEENSSVLPKILSFVLATRLYLKSVQILSE